MFSPKPPIYEHSIKLVGTIRVLCIVDLHSEANPSLTVTNGVDLVLKEIAKEIGELPEIIIYKDSDGIWDRIKAKPDGSFISFAPIVPGGERTENDEKALLLAVTSIQKGAAQ